MRARSLGVMGGKRNREVGWVPSQDIREGEDPAAL